MNFTKKWRFLKLELILYWLIISMYGYVLCMDTDQPSKGILNAELPISGADVPIIPLSIPSSQKSSKTHSQVYSNLI